jgi:hypothetical protein
MDQKIISRKEALEQGLKFYYTGKPCSKGHFDIRDTASKNCKTCKDQRYKEHYEKTKNSVLKKQRKQYEENPDLFRGRSRQYYEQNKAKHILKCKLRVKHIKQATPPWVRLEDLSPFYKERDRLTKETGIPHEVDHIIPLRHSLVCGLNVPANLQVSYAADNRSKSNKFEID